MGAKPVCNTDVFCFAPPETDVESLPPGVQHPRRIIKGVVAGVRDYGNRMGIPTVNGAVYTTGGRAISFGGSGRVTNPLASFSVPNVSGTLQVSVSWRFNGTYNGTPLKYITAQSTISI